MTMQTADTCCRLLQTVSHCNSLLQDALLLKEVDCPHPWRQAALPHAALTVTTNSSQSQKMLYSQSKPSTVTMETSH